MQRWQYKVCYNELTEDELNELGRDGWELLTPHQGTTYLRRPLGETVNDKLSQELLRHGIVPA